MRINYGSDDGDRSQEFDTLFDYTFQSGPKLNLLNINIPKSKYGISIYQPDHIMKNIIQEYWEKWKIWGKILEITFSSEYILW